ncbi:hypothetical protein [Planctomicrobium sp. SH527]|uniref:hypothetical protein n=1 Tax=Planctomicrobium sp. SH527 TaxID=3448123 RepID=UPI003F5C72F8
MKLSIPYRRYAQRTLSLCRDLWDRQYLPVREIHGEHAGRSQGGLGADSVDNVSVNIVPAGQFEQGSLVDRRCCPGG